jgi:DNA-binding transcriptional ArsR family regulator
MGVTEPADSAKIKDPAAMRALAHPARLAILDHLSLNEEGATATQCAEVVGLSPSATSYHLRALAKAGLIEEAPSRGDGRERVWQAKYRGYSVSGGRDDAPEFIAAEAELVEAFMARGNERVRRYMERARTEPEDWYDLARLQETTLLLTPEEMTGLMKAIDELIEPLNARRRSATPATRRVSFQLRMVSIE